MFVWIIMSISIIFICVLFTYMGLETQDKLHEELDDMTEEGSHVNYSKTIDDTFTQVNVAYTNLVWISVFLIVGMVLAVFIGSYMVTTKPVFFVIFIFLGIIAIIVSGEIANAYEDRIMTDDTLGSTFDKFSGANWIVLNLPLWVTIISFGGGIIMYVRLVKGREERMYG